MNTKAQIQLREKFHKETGVMWETNDKEPDIDYVEWLEAKVIVTEVPLAKTVIKVLDTKARAGCDDSSWVGYSNGNGTEIGVDIERLIKQAKRLLANFG